MSALLIEAGINDLGLNRVEQYSKPAIVELDLGTDLDSSLRFAEVHADKLRFCPGLGWLYWDGKRWATGGELRAVELSKTSARDWYIKYSAYNGENRETRIKLALSLESAAHIKNTVELAKSDNRLVVAVAALDSNQWKLNVLNGTLDLRTGKLEAHSGADLCTKLAPVTFDPMAKHPALDRFMQTCETGTPGISSFLARCFGAALTGDASAETLFLLQGDGGSGKTTLVEAVAAMLGDYAVKMNFESFCQSRHGRSPGAASPDLVMLRGARLAYASEGDQSARLDAGKVKELTGNEPVTARGLYTAPITFPQTWKLWLVSNFDPKADSEDTGIWRRMMKLHFTAIPEKLRDPAVKRALMEDSAARSALLNWALAGCLDWQKQGGGRIGLAPPDSVSAMTNAYRTKQDTLSEWWKDLLATSAKLQSDESATKASLRKNYDDWCDDNGATAVQPKRFSTYLQGKGLESIRRTAGVGHWKGIMLTP